MAQLQANFVNSKEFFYAGETVVGHVTVLVQGRSITHCRGLELVFRGTSHCYLGGDERHDYRNNETYFSKTIHLLVTPEHLILMPVAPGEHNFPFSFTLPAGIPPSFELRENECFYGFVHYNVQILFKYNMRELEVKIPLMVRAAPVDFSKSTRLLQPVSSDAVKNLGCLWCKSGPIRVKCQLSKRAFHPGETMLFDCEVDNMATTKDLGQIKGKLVRSVMLLTSFPKRKEEVSTTTVCSVIVPGEVKRRSQGAWQDIRLNIPADIVSSFDNCKCIHLSYTFVLVVHAPARQKIEVKIPVKIYNAFPPQEQPTISQTQ